MWTITRAAGAAAAAGLALTGVLALPSQAAVSGPSVAAPTRCTNAELTASYRAAGAAMSHRYGRLILTNTSDRTCTTQGYSGLSYVGHGDGTQIGAAADRDTSGPRARRIVLAPADRAVSRVSETVSGVYPRHLCRPTHVDGFRVYLPGETRSQYVRHPLTGCANHRVHLLSLRALR